VHGLGNGLEWTFVLRLLDGIPNDYSFLPAYTLDQESLVRLGRCVHLQPWKQGR